MNTGLSVLLFGLVALYVVLCPRVNVGLYRDLLFHPAKFDDDQDSRAPEIAGVQGENVTFQNSDGGTLYGWYFAKPNSKYTVLLSHGNGGNVSYRRDTVGVLLNANASVMIYDYRGYGLSDGLPSADGICADAVSAYDYLTNQRKVPKDQMVLYGESLGCAVTTYLSTQRKSAGIIMQSGFASLGRIATEIFPLLWLYPGPLLANPPLDSLSILKKHHPPLLIVHGHKDQVVPFDHAKALFKAATEPKRFLELPICGHNDICSAAEPMFSAALHDFFSWLNVEPATKASTITASARNKSNGRH